PPQAGPARQGHGLDRSAGRAPDDPHRGAHRAPADAQEGPPLAPRPAQARRPPPPPARLPAAHQSRGLPRPDQGARPEEIGAEPETEGGSLSEPRDRRG